MFGVFKSHRESLRAQPLAPAWRAIIEKNVAYTAHLDESERVELEGLVQIFLAEKHFEGCGGLILNDEMRVTIAAQACLLLLHRPSDVYPGLDTILVYPHPYLVANERRDGAVVWETEETRLGESWTRGVLVLAWDHVNTGAHHRARPGNVVIHEFAHQLDAENGSMDGAPALDKRGRYATWARILGDEYDELSARLHAGRKSDIDPYGSQSPAEFFAVVSEMFFEAPKTLLARHPALYSELEAFYKQDPASKV